MEHGSLHSGGCLQKALEDEVISKLRFVITVIKASWECLVVCKRESRICVCCVTVTQLWQQEHEGSTATRLARHGSKTWLWMVELPEPFQAFMFTQKWLTPPNTVGHQIPSALHYSSFQREHFLGTDDWPHSQLGVAKAFSLGRCMEKKRWH